jgi:hypothetical protein
MTVCERSYSTILGSAVLNLTSRFVLQVLPYLLIALAAVVLLPEVANSLKEAASPAAASSPPHEIEKIEPVGHGETTLDFIHQDREAFAPKRFAKVDLEDR